jgi:hypothetical protein
MIITILKEIPIISTWLSMLASIWLLLAYRDWGYLIGALAFFGLLFLSLGVFRGVPPKKELENDRIYSSE